MLHDPQNKITSATYEIWHEFNGSKAKSESSKNSFSPTWDSERNKFESDIRSAERVKTFEETLLDIVTAKKNSFFDLCEKCKEFEDFISLTTKL